VVSTIDAKGVNRLALMSLDCAYHHNKIYDMPSVTLHF